MQIWVISDTHFSHANCITKFKRRDGSPLRDFRDVDHMNETIIANWNALVKPHDHIYHLGDVALRKSDLHIVHRLNGHKRLVRGNHDIFRTKNYLEAGFEEIHGCRVLDNVMMTHVPIHPDCLGRFRGNLHGHIHENVLPTEEQHRDHNKGVARPYLNVGVEVLGYAPITLEDAIQRLGRGGHMPVEKDLVEEIELLGE